MKQTANKSLHGTLQLLMAIGTGDTLILPQHYLKGLGRSSGMAVTAAPHHKAIYSVRKLSRLCTTGDTPDKEPPSGQPLTSPPTPICTLCYSVVFAPSPPGATIAERRRMPRQARDALVACDPGFCMAAFPKHTKPARAWPSTLSTMLRLGACAVDDDDMFAMLR